jgi:uncharacterized membrane protein SirB2
VGEFYLQIKWAHIAAVITSGVLFLLRGIAVQAGARWAMAAPLRYLSYAIDTILLIAAMMLISILHQYPFVQAWLTAKVCLLVVYIALGTFALRRGRTQRVRLICLVVALAVYAFIISIAIAHHPLGVVYLLRE